MSTSHYGLVLVVSFLGSHFFRISMDTFYRQLVSLDPISIARILRGAAGADGDDGLWILFLSPGSPTFAAHWEIAAIYSRLHINLQIKKRKYSSEMGLSRLSQWLRFSWGFIC